MNLNDKRNLHKLEGGGRLKDVGEGEVAEEGGGRGVRI